MYPHITDTDPTVTGGCFLWIFFPILPPFLHYSLKADVLQQGGAVAALLWDQNQLFQPCSFSTSFDERFVNGSVSINNQFFYNFGWRRIDSEISGQVLPCPLPPCVQTHQLCPSLTRSPAFRIDAQQFTDSRVVAGHCYFNYQGVWGPVVQL